MQSTTGSPPSWTANYLSAYQAALAAPPRGVAIRTPGCAQSSLGAFMLLGSAAAFSVAVPVTIMTATDAEARVGNPGSAVSVAGANRRDRRQDRRYKKPPTTTTPTTTGQGEKK
jgi:hypothetical protein